MKISVIIPVYNAEKLLEKAVLSALQFDEVKEVLLIEDASPDNSLEVCKKLVNEHPRVILYQHPDQGNHGAGATRNLGLEKASQDYIAFLDADDYYLPNRFDAERELFKNPKIEGVFGAIGTEFLSEKGKEEFKAKFNSNITTVNYSAEGREIFEGLIGIPEKPFGAFFSLIALTVRRSSILKNNLEFNPKLRIHQDSDFILRLSYYCHLKTGEIKTPISIRGVHDNNRITKVKPYSTNYYKNQLAIHESLFHWSLKKNIEKKYREIFRLSYISLTAANLNGISKHIYYFKNCIFYPKLLKTRYRFNALNTHIQ